MMAKISVFNRGEGGCKRWRGCKVEIMEEEAFEVERTRLFYTRAPGHYQQNPRRRRLKYTDGMEQASHFWRKGSSLSDAIDSVHDDAPGEVNSTASWMNKSDVHQSQASAKEDASTSGRQGNLGADCRCVRGRRTLCGRRTTYRSFRSLEICSWRLVL